jgi:hypothetical protein
MIFIDSNIPMYLVGTAHPHKVEAEQVLTTFIAHRQKLVSDVEVLQEILHRYTANGRRDAIQPAFDALLGIVDEMFPIDLDDVDRARILLLGKYRLSARHAIHIAVMERRKVDQILSFDRGFDRFPGLQRMPPK